MRGAEIRARPFILPLIGLALLFAALGPAIGGVLFVPLAVILKPPVAADALALSALVAALFGHTILLVAAYVIGVGPAAATGFLYALWDAAVPDRWPRSLVAAVIGGAVAHAERPDRPLPDRRPSLCDRFRGPVAAPPRRRVPCRRALDHRSDPAPGR